mmetsp:Transcript_19549/g.40943  ORF Transcript_19549/g.40943 Transcript_19549/m.40943 type:complete len:83 (-) Transcript_19549:563-811(-)
MELRDSYFQFKEICVCSLELSGKFQEPNKHEQKTMLFGIFPLNYCLKFQENGKKIEDKSMESIVDYFQTLHEAEESCGGFKK